MPSQDSNTPSRAPAEDRDPARGERHAPGEKSATAKENASPKASKKEVVAKVGEHSPGLRSAVHFGALLLAFPICWLATDPQFDALGISLRIRYGWVWASAILLLGALINIVVLPMTAVGKQVMRAGDGRFLWGGVMYPLGLAIGFLIFKPFAVAAAWAAMAAGDATAATVGQRLSGPKLPWNPRKSWAGTVAFCVAAIPACTLLLWWCPSKLFLTSAGAPEWPFVWTLAVVAAVAGAILESLEGPFDDNLRLVLGVGLTVWLAEQFLNFGTSQMPLGRHFQPEWLLHALIVNAILAGGVWLARFADLPGSIAGGMAGAVVYFFALPQGYALMVFFVIAGSLLSRLGREKKEERKAAEAREGTRGIRNVLANLAVPALCCLAYAASKAHAAALLAFAGALAAAMADTASSEIGALSSRKPKLITSRKEVEHGADGGVTWLGYIAAAVSCLLLAGVAWGGGFWSVVRHGHEWNIPGVSAGWGLAYMGIALLAGLAGTTVDSLLGATVEGRIGGFGKHAVNFVCTLAGAAVAGGIGLLIF